MLTRAVLDGNLTKRIDRICPLGYANASDNHCAHFVSHVLGFSFGFTCGQMVRGTGAKACIRVHEVFSRCPVVGVWEAKPIVLITCLIFITKASNVNLAARAMENVPRKHVGIYFDNLVWHYSNTREQVVNQTLAEFGNHYPSPHNSLFYGQIPWVLQLPT